MRVAWLISLFALAPLAFAGDKSKAGEEAASEEAEAPEAPASEEATPPEAPAS